MRLRVSHSIGDLAADMDAISAKPPVEGAKVVGRNMRQGQRLAQRFARASSGPHGRLYYKRITAEKTGPLQGEFGPEGNVAGNAVGAGWRGGPQNTDLPRAADVAGPQFARDVSKMVDGWFW